ncbi:MAG: ribosome biogenesis GTP-binding protein YihA/YsxC [Crocinitomicaceae bacterium]|nr:ribosome biogenesis GTP-binding protein YihA/YsxC [Crocinitomicaceae bacterium]
MKINSAKFVISNTDIKKCPKPDRPEYAFIGRSNVGKSSLINMLTNNKKLAKTSGKPGKTQLINHFEINDEWYLVDLPGYGYAQVSKSSRVKWQKFIETYLLKRENLMNVFVLIDSRHPPQKIDLEFMEWLGTKGIPFSMVFTKADKCSSNELRKSQMKYKNEMLKTWEFMPPVFITSSTSKLGQEKLLNYIGEINVNARF